MIVTVTGHAKINLYLKIVDRLPNGYHRLESMMQSLLLHDVLELEPTGHGISFSYEWVDPVQQGASYAAVLGDMDVAGEIPRDQHNLAWKAAELLRRYCRVERSVSIRLRKAIPMAAGLAGGSADAAAVLLGLNKMWQLNLDLPELMTLGAQLGADVPFCLAGGSKFCTGIGDVVSDAPAAPSWSVLLVKPNFSVSTAEVYRRWDEGGFGEDRQEMASWEGLRCALESQDLAAVGRNLYNELEWASQALVPEIGAWKELTAATGPKGVLMTGSGPTVFALYETESEALAAANQLADLPKTPGPAQIIVTKLWMYGCRVGIYGGSCNEETSETGSIG